MFDKRYQSRIISLWKYPNDYHQFSAYTSKNRYPDLFLICSNYFKDTASPLILSFGCSTGEEVESLGEIVPNAKIIGTDLNDWCIKECKKKYTNQNWLFFHSHSKEFVSLRNFDAIFCLAIFQNPENRHKKNIEYSKEYPFSKFENQIGVLNEKLKEGGLLFIDHADFNFLETKYAEEFEVYGCNNNRILRNRPSFDFKNKKTAEYNFNYRIFKKKQPNESNSIENS